MKKRLLYLIYSLLFFLPAIGLGQTATHVVMSEVYGGGGNTGAPYTNDYIELYNPTGADVVMTNWSIQYTSAAGTTWGTTGTNGTIAAFSGTIKSHGFFLIQLGAGTTVTNKPLPTPDATGGINMSAASGKVALVNNSTQLSQVANPTDASIVDLIGFFYSGTAPTGYETNYVTIPSTYTGNTWSVERKSSSTSTQASLATGGADELLGNGYDTDNNSTDLVGQSTPNPQNSSSALETPPGAAVASLTANPTSLDFLTTTTVGNSSVKTFSLSGSNLSASTTLTAVAPYTLSKDGTTYAASITYTTTELSTAQTVSVKFSPTSTTTSSGTVSIASGTATTTVALTGTGASATPTLTASQTSLTFGSQTAGTSSAAQTFTLSGSGLSTNTTVSVAAPFAVSKDGITYSTLLTYTPADLATAQTVSVQFNPTAAGSPTGTITIASTGATSKTIALSGTATAASGGGATGTATHVVMSEVYGGGGNTGAPYTNDYIELYNPTGADVVMTNWSIQYTSAAGTTWGTTGTNGTIAAFSGTIKSHGFFLIQLGAGTTVTNKPLPTPDATGGINMSAASGKVALVNNSTQLSQVANPTDASIVDLIGFFYSGTAPTGYETNYVTIPSTYTSNTWSVERKSSSTSTQASLATGGADELLGNGYDTDNNSTDLVGQSTPNPQNSSSALETPPGGAAATPAPALAVTPTSLAFGTTTALNTPSTPQTFSLSATNLTASVTVTTAAPYTVSKDGLVYSTTITYTTAELATAKTVSVQFTPTTTNATTGSVSITSTGAVGQGVILTGTGTSAPVLPTLTVTPTSLAFGNVNVGVASAAKTFAISGANLTASATVTATAPYTISRTSATAGFGTSVTFTAAELAAATAPTVWVILTPTAAGPANSTITTNSTGVVTPPSVTVTGTGVVPVLTATPTTLAFGSVTVNTTSGNQSFVLSGTNLTGSTTVTASTLYQLSKDGSTNWATSLTYTTTDLAANQTVYVRLLSPAIAGDASGSATITTTGTGANSPVVTFTATATLAPVPTLTVTPASLTFSSFVASSAPVQSYTLSGVNLTGATTVTVATPYSVSKTSAGTYGTTLTYTTAELATAQTVFVKFSPTVVAVGGVNNGSALNATTGGTTQSVTLNGTGVGVPALTVTPATLSYSAVIGTTSVAQSYTLSGVYLTANTTVTVAAPYSVSKTATGTFGTTLTYTPTDLATAQQVFVQFSPTVVAAGGVNNGAALNASAGAVSQTVTLNGTGSGVPALTVNPATLVFTQAVGSTSAAQTFTLSGANITSGVTLTASGPYTISKTSTGGYSTSLTYTATDLAAAQTVYVAFTPTAITALNAATGSVVATSTGATSQTVTLTGTGVNSAPTVAAIADQSVCYTTAMQSIPLTGITAGAETNQIVIVSVTSSNPTLLASIGVLPVSGGATVINYNIANGQSGTTTITVTVKDNGLAANNGNDTFTRTFNLTVNALPVITVTSDAKNNIVEKGTTATLTATGGGTGATYVWSSTVPGNIISSLTGSTITIRPSIFATYTATVTNACGTGSVKGSLGVEISNVSKLETSNVLTPNGDGKNDYWVVRNIDLYPLNSVKVFDKSGKIVFTKAGYNNEWDGYYNGSPLPQGTYYYVVDTGTGIPYRGTITVVRD